MKMVMWLVAAICLVGCGEVAPPVVIPETIFIGDSITETWRLGSYFVGAENAGVSGQTSAVMLARFDRDVIAHHPKIVVILAGTNDMIRVSNPTTHNIAEMAARASARGVHVILCTIPPIERWSAGITITDPDMGNPVVAAFNQSLVDVAHKYGYSLADYHTAMLLPDGSANDALFKDGLHPNRAGYQVMAKVIAPLLH